MNELATLASALLRPAGPQDNKYSRGVLGFVTGSESYPGAGILGVAGAEAIGLGMTKYFGPRRVADLLLVQHPQVVAAESLNPQNSSRVQAWVLGSGLPAGDSLQTENLLRVVSRGDLVAVVDAGALEILDFSKLTGSNLLLTPHDGELRKLMIRMGDSVTDEDFASLDSRADLAARAANILSQTVLLKGSTTLVADSTGHIARIGPNSPHLASAGTGDVLAGMLGALAVRNLDKVRNSWLEVAELAVKLHSNAAEIAAQTGPDVASRLPQAVWQILHQLNANLGEETHA